MRDRIVGAINWLLRPLGLGLTANFKPDARVDDSGSMPGFYSVPTGAGPMDRLYSDLLADYVDALEAWRRNFMIRQIVRLTTAYVVGDRISVSSSVEEVDSFLTEFWSHGENRMDARLIQWSDEFTRVGEIYPVLFTSRLTGMSDVRAVPATQIVSIISRSEDYEYELGYNEHKPGSIEPKFWKSKNTAKIRGKPDPLMLHYRVNEVVGATRGEGDLGPVLPWALRYSEWLKDRVEFNRLRTRSNVLDIEVANDRDVKAKQAQYAASPPLDGSVFVHGPGEKANFKSTLIQGYDSEPDGRAIRLAVAAGSNTPIHFFGEGSSATRSTASEMGDPTHRHYRIRQEAFKTMVVDFCSWAWKRYEQVHKLEPIDPQIVAEAPDVSRADNKDLAEAAKTIVDAFVQMKGQGWIDDELATRLSFKFAGEILSEDQIRTILNSNGQHLSQPQPQIEKNGKGGGKLK